MMIWSNLLRPYLGHSLEWVFDTATIMISNTQTLIPHFLKETDKFFPRSLAQSKQVPIVLI